jgi:hypothetical protein
MTESVRVSVANTFSCRDGNPNNNSIPNDAFILNGVVQKDAQGPYVRRRAGYENSGVTVGNLPQQGIFYFNGFVYVVSNDVLTRSTGSNFGGTNGAAFTQSAVPQWGTRSFAPAVVFQDRIFIIGGGGGAGGVGYPDVTQSQDGVSWAVNAGAAPFGSRIGHRLVVFNNKLFLIGGNLRTATSLTCMNDVWSSPDGTNWTQLQQGSTTWAPRRDFGCVAGNNGIYILGGNQSEISVNLLSDVWFSSDGMNWTRIAATSPWGARTNFSCFFFQPFPEFAGLWVIGGADAGGIAKNDCWFSYDGLNWVQRTASAFAQGRSQMAGAIYAGKMWLLGGTVSLTADANVYNSIDGITWTLVTTVPGWSGKAGMSAVAFRVPYTVSPYRYETLWVMAGQSGATLYNEVWRGNLNTQISNTYALNPTTPGQSYQFTTYINGTKIVLKNQSNMWVLSGAALTKVADPNYPAVTVPGLITLDAFLHVMSPGGDIHNCTLDVPTEWPALNFITADYEDDPGVALAKYLNYIVAFGQWTGQFFYDAAQPEASELLPYISANMRVGCVNASTIVNMNNTLFWVGQTEKGQRHVYTLNGMVAQPVSNESIDLWLMAQDPTTLCAWAWTAGGHMIYVLSSTNLSGPNISYAYENGLWYFWQFNQLVPPVYVTSGFGQQQNYMIDQSDNNVKFIDAQHATDPFGNAFLTAVQTESFDAGTMFNKFWGRVTLVCQPSLVNTSTSINTRDNDYLDITFRGSVNEALPRPNLTRQGASRRRAWYFGRQDAWPLQWRYLEVQYSNGES